MRDRARQRAAIVAAIALLAGMAPGTAPALAIAPQPVLPVEDPRPPRDEPVERGHPCLVGWSGTPAGTLVGPADPGPFRLTAYPGPVLPIDPGPGEGPVGPDEGPPDERDEPPDERDEPPDPGCRVELSLTLVVRSHDGERPTGANASVDDLAVPSGALESGFGASLPARSRAIRLSDPGEDWRLTDTRCTCTGSLGLLATYPGPVLPIDPGGGGCQLLAGAPPAVRLSTYPGPVLPLDPGRELGEPRDDDPGDPPLARSITVGWDTAGTVTISDPDRIGAVVACVWTVEQELPTPKEGRWRSDHGVGRIECPGFSQRIPGGDRDVGRITHRRGGDRLVARGVAEGRVPITVDRDPDNPRRYTGTVRLPIQGARADFSVTLRVVTEEQLEGRLNATIRVRGTRCTANRPFTLTYVGP
jgi:hypothetical protein